MKKTLFFIVLATLCLNFKAKAQTVTKLTGRVIDSADNKPLHGATITIKSTGAFILTNENGEFRLTTTEVRGFLIVTYVGYKTRQVDFNETDKGPFNISLLQDESQLKEVSVVSTGYQNIPKDRATGSFVLIDSALINRSVSTDILSRLNGVTSGLSFAQPSLLGQGASTIEIHGRSTLFADPNPLIVLDNFPYDGDINNINPNDVESITVLKDAAASSIWGARAGNGVIVITTKKGHLNSKPSVSFNSSINVGEKPNLYYTPQLTSAQYIDVEQYLFNQGKYDTQISDGYDALSPAVAIFAAARNGSISKADSVNMINLLKGYDIRQQLLKYFYQPSVNQQYETSISGGGSSQKYFVSAGYDKNLANTVGNSYDRVTLNASNTYYLLKNKLEIYSNILYTASKTQTVPTYTPNQPYDQVADQNGNPIAVANGLNLNYVDTAGNGKLLNWQYKPLDELRNRYGTNTSNLTDYKLNFNATYNILKGFSAAVLYAYEKGINESNQLEEEQSYYTRNLINTYTEINGDGSLTYPIPLGGILQNSTSNTSSQNARFQLNYNHSWGKNSVYAIAGSEIKDVTVSSNTTELYGYDPGTETDQNSSVNYTAYYPFYYGANGGVIQTGTGEGSTDNRFFSYFFNGSYSYADKYIASLSARRDESNLFGVNTNQKGVPLWSSGLSWVMDKETFYNLEWLPKLKLGVTYGYTGNVDNALSAYLTAVAGQAYPQYGAVSATIQNPPNPSLRWEKIGNLDFSINFSTKNNRLNAKIDYWTKNGMDLIGNSPIAPQTGITTFTGNNASTFTKGADIQLDANILNGKFKWLSTLLYNFSHSEVTKYTAPNGSNLNVVSSNYTNPLQGYPYYPIFSFKYAGLNNAGDPIGYLNGQPSTDYASIVTSANRSDLIYNGSATPTSFGSLRNTLVYRAFDFSFNITYKFGYYFRRTSLTGSSLYYGDYQLADYGKQWQKPGDELTTDVPALIYPTNPQRDDLYEYSNILVQNGDNVRLQDLRLGYTFAKEPHLPFSNLNIYVYANNIGILWRANKYQLDPDYPNEGYIPNPRTIALGLRTDF